jgi:RHS repeat-associated protein
MTYDLQGHKPGPQGGLHRMLTDHLGSPQKMTDGTQALVWDAQFDPFGEEVSISGAAAHPTRFLGQYADPETGFSYNYFRDYDPTIGRYVQSDPIGLVGGINIFEYAGGSPVIRSDKLEPIQEVRIHEQGDGLVKRRSMRRIMARRKKAATVRA